LARGTSRDYVPMFSILLLDKQSKILDKLERLERGHKRDYAPVDPI